MDDLENKTPVLLVTAGAVVTNAGLETMLRKSPTTTIRTEAPPNVDKLSCQSEGLEFTWNRQTKRVRPHSTQRPFCPRWGKAPSLHCARKRRLKIPKGSGVVLTKRSAKFHDPEGPLLFRNLRLSAFLMRSFRWVR